MHNIRNDIKGYPRLEQFEDVLQLAADALWDLTENYLSP